MRPLLFVLALLCGQTAQAACRDVTFEELSYTVCDAHIGEDVRLFLKGPDGAYGGFPKWTQIWPGMARRWDLP
jgi:hypothetical protein